MKKVRASCSARLYDRKRPMRVAPSPASEASRMYVSDFSQMGRSSSEDDELGG